MAGFPEFLFAWTQLPANADIAALIGTRVFPYQAARKAVLPRISYFRISGASEGRDLAGPTNTVRQRFQLGFWAQTAQQADTLSRLVAGTRSDPRLDGYRGYVAGVHILMCILTDEQDNSEPLTPGDDTGTYCIMRDVDVTWRN